MTTDAQKALEKLWDNVESAQGKPLHELDDLGAAYKCVAAALSQAEKAEGLARVLELTRNYISDELIANAIVGENGKTTLLYEIDKALSAYRDKGEVK